MKKLNLKTLLLTLLCVMGVNANATVYKLVTSAADLVDGCNYLIVSSQTNGTAKAMGKINASNRSAVAVTIADGEINVTTASSTDDTTNPYVIRLEANGSNWDLFDVAAEKYLSTTLSTTGTSNTMLTTQTETGTYTEASISISSNKASIIFQGRDSRNIVRYNSGSSLFSCYSSGQSDIYLYKEEVAADPYTVTFNAGNNGTCSTSSLTETSAGAGIILPSCTPNTGYGFLGWTATEGNATIDTGLTAGETYHPRANTTLYAVYGKKYMVNIATPENGSIAVSCDGNTVNDGDYVASGTLLDVVATPSSNEYKFSSWNITGATASTNKATTTVTMEDANVSINATFEINNDIVFNFNDKDVYPSEFPTATGKKANAEVFNIGGNNLIINAPDAYYIINNGNDASRGLFYGKTVAANGKPSSTTAYLGFPARAGYKLTKVTVTTTPSVAGSVKMNIYDTSWNAMSTELTTASATKQEFIFNISNSTANTEYRLASGSSGKNLQFDNIVLTYEKVEPVYTMEVLTLVANDGSKYWATFSNSQDVFIDEDAMPYAVTVADNAMNLNDDAFEADDIEIDGTPVSGYWIPANTGVLLQSSSDEVFYWTVENVNLGAISADNNLYPASKDKAELTGHLFYKLAYATSAKDNLGFYWGAESGAAFTSREGSAYLAVPTPAGARPRGFAFNGNTSGISEISTSAANTVTYNLAGQRVNANAKGIVVVNGKKILK